jgi:hypothetical protein
MGDEVHLWRVGPDEQLIEIKGASLDLESRLQEWLVREVSMLDPALLVIGRRPASARRPRASWPNPITGCRSSEEAGERGGRTIVRLAY